MSNDEIIRVVPGIYPHLSFRQYETIDAFSRRKLDFKTPAHLQCPEEDKDTHAMKLGRAIHTAILEPAELQGRYLVIKKLNWSTTAGKAQREELNSMAALDPDFEWFDSAEFQDIAMMAEAFKRHRYAPKMIEGADHELSIVWEDEISGLFCKTRIDSYDRGAPALVEYKTAIEADRTAFSKVIYERAYYRQAAFQRAALRAHGLPIGNFYWIVQEKSGEYQIAIYQADEGDLLIGEMENARALRTIAECRKTGTFPGYPEKPLPISMPSWAKSRINDRTLEAMEEF